MTALPHAGPALLVLFLVLLLAHIAAGFVAMGSGLMPLFTLKGNREHRLWGTIFVWAMGFASLSAFPLAYFRSDPFQAAVGVFSGYLTFFGLRVIRRGRPESQVSVWDWALALGSFAVFLALLGAGARALAASPALLRTAGSQAVAALMFGLLGLAVAGRDIHSLAVRDFSRRRRITDHMIALSLALLTGYSAFLNTQLTRITGLNWPIAAKMGLPFALFVPPLLIWAWVWDRRLRTTKELQKRKVKIMPAKRRRPEVISEAVSGTDQEPPEQRRLRHLGVVEGISFLLLLCIAVPLKHMFGIPIYVRILGPIHGGVFILYVLSVFVAAPVLRWTRREIGVALAAAVIPFGTFVLDARLRKSSELSAK